jgi:hypothetical protein
MTDMLIPLLDTSDPENVKRFDDFCTVFFKDYDKENKGYISKKDVKEPLQEIINHFSKNSLSYYKLKLLFSMLDNSANNKIGELNELIDTLNTNNTDDGISNAIKILDKNNNDHINFEDFKEIVRLFLYCLIDESLNNEIVKNNNNINLYSSSDELDELDESKLLELLDNGEYKIKDITIDQFICTIIDEILSDLDDIIYPIDLRDALKEIIDDILIDDKQINIDDTEFEKLLYEFDIDILDTITKITAEQILYTFIVKLIDNNIE